MSDRVLGEGQQVQAHQDSRKICFPVSEAVSKVLALFFRRLNVSFSIFHMARPGPTGRISDKGCCDTSSRPLALMTSI